MESSFGTAFDSIITNTKSAGDAFKDMGVSMLRTAANMFAQKAFQAIMGTVIGGVFSLGGTSSAVAVGANARGAANSALFGPGFAVGGDIRGGSGYRDDVPMLAMGGEYMIRKSAVSKLRQTYGAGIMDVLNEGKIPSLYAAGGSVALSSPSPLVKTSPSALSARPMTGSSDAYTFNITLNEGASSGSPPAGKSGGLDSEALIKVIRATTVAEINRQKLQGGALR